MTPLIVGALLAVVALVIVLFPLFDELASPKSRALAPQTAAPSAEAVQALREIEFDRETGKLSDSDYTALKTRYTREAVAALRAEETGPPSSDNDAVETVILQYRQRLSGCSVCGPRPEPDAIYCSTCGRYLAASCAHCRAPVNEIGALYCGSCGESLAA